MESFGQRQLFIKPFLLHPSFYRLYLFRVLLLVIIIVGIPIFISIFILIELTSHQTLTLSLLTNFNLFLCLYLALNPTLPTLFFSFHNIYYTLALTSSQLLKQILDFLRHLHNIFVVRVRLLILILIQLIHIGFIVFVFLLLKSGLKPQYLVDSLPIFSRLLCVNGYVLLFK